MDSQSSKRMILIFASTVDMLFSGAILLIYFGFLPVDISRWGIPRWVVGLVGGVWFIGSLVIFVYQLTKPDISE